MFTSPTRTAPSPPTRLNLGSATDKVYLELYGTGLQSAGVANFNVTMAGVTAPVLYAGPQGRHARTGSSEHSDSTRSLSVSGNVTIQLTVSGIKANPVEVTLQ